MKVLIIDDDKLVALSLKTILDEGGEQIDVIGVGNSGREAIELYGRLHPDILLMDIRMEEMTGLDAGKQILETHPDAKILFLTTFSDDEYIVKALGMGAKGYLLKQNFESIAPALAAVHRGQAVFGDEVITRLPDLMKPPKEEWDFGEYGITEKELEIIRQVATGRNNKEIAETLFLSEGTVRNYLSSILEKLGLRDRTQLAVFYYRNES